MLRLAFTAWLLAGVLAGAEITGTWTGVRLNGDGLEEPLTLRLKASSGVLEGSVRISAGEIPVRDGKWDGAAFRFVTVIPFVPAAQTTVYRGEVEGERMRIVMERDGGRTLRQGSARRTSPDPEPYLKSLPVTMPEMEPLPDEGLSRRPPMGWNSWYVFGDKIDDRTVREISEAMAKNGMRDAGYVYINVDDGWQGTRDAEGMLRPNSRFPDMKALSDFLHMRGFNFGLYSSPGPKTCAGYEGSWGHEELDARAWGLWGVDYLKYDWCTAGLVWDTTAMGRAYRRMAEAIRAARRKMVFSICQYGLYNVWEWGASAGGHLWRTTVDIGDSWESMSSIGFAQAGLERFAGPGRWNDPDVLQVGKGGMTANEYRVQMTLWAMLAAPLLVAADVRKLDAETLEMLTNPEVIAVDQDLLAKPGRPVIREGSLEVWTRQLLPNDAQAIAIFNRGDASGTLSFDWKQLGFKNEVRLRDLWRRQNLPRLERRFRVHLAPHSCLLLSALDR